MARPSSRTLSVVALFLAGVVAVYLLPSFISSFRAQQFAYVGIYLIALIGLNILTGYTGQISLGHGAFMAIGGYTTGILISDQGLQIAGHTFSNDLKDVWTIPVAAVVAGAAGFLFGLPALRLSGLYLALATFAIAVSAPAVFKKFETFTGGGTGINLFGIKGLTGSISGVHVFGHKLDFYDWLYYLSWTIALVLLAAAWFLLHGRIGRAFRAVRDSETAAASSGVSLATYKTLAFAVSAAYAGVAGALYAIANTYVNPDTFPITLSIFLLVGVVVGGLGTLSGLVVGAVLVQFLPLWSQEISKSPGAPAVVYGVVLIAIMLALPGGVAGLLRRVLPLARRLYTRPR
jgi:branched-chain amino acid transport system permease protein